MDSTWGAVRTGVAGFDPFFVAAVEPAAFAAAPDGRSFVTAALRGAPAAFGVAVVTLRGAAFLAAAFAGAGAGRVTCLAGAAFAGAFLTGLAGATFLAAGFGGALATFFAGAGFVAFAADFLAGAGFFADADLATGRVGAAFFAAGLAVFFAAGAAFFAVFLDATSAFSFFP